MVEYLDPYEPTNKLVMVGCLMTKVTNLFNMDSGHSCTSYLTSYNTNRT